MSLKHRRRELVVARALTLDYDDRAGRDVVPERAVQLDVKGRSYVEIACAILALPVPRRDEPRPVAGCIEAGNRRR